MKKLYIVLAAFVLGTFMVIGVKNKSIAPLDLFEKAQAITTISFSSLNPLTGFHDFVVGFYLLVNGPTSEYQLDSGPENGLVGIINNLWGANGFGGLLTAKSITTCDQIPTTGSDTVTEGADTYVFTYATGAGKTIPSRFGYNAGEDFDKKIAVAKNGTAMVNGYLKCHTTSGRYSGLVEMSVTESSGGIRKIAMYFQSDETSKAGYIDMYMTYVLTDSEKVAIFFTTTDGSAFQLYLGRVASSGSGQYALFGINGVGRTQASVHAVFVTDSTNTQAIDTVSHNGGNGLFQVCVDFAANSQSLGATCSGLAINAAPTLNSTYATTTAFTIVGLNSLTIPALQ